VACTATLLAADGLDYLLTIVVYRAEEDPALEAQKALVPFLAIVGGGRVLGMG
jgi:hypothetical protein